MINKNISRDIVGNYLISTMKLGKIYKTTVLRRIKEHEYNWENPEWTDTAETENEALRNHHNALQFVNNKRNKISCNT